MSSNASTQSDEFEGRNWIALLDIRAETGKPKTYKFIVADCDNASSVIRKLDQNERFNALVKAYPRNGVRIVPDDGIYEVVR